MQLNDRPVLPDEIFSLIFTFFDGDVWVYHRTLLAFSLVSRRFRQWCQSLAVRQLYLKTDSEDGEKLIRDLERATAMNASIGPSVQTLLITFHCNAQYDEPRMKDPMAKFLSRLTSIKFLDISIDSYDLVFLERWSSISEPIRVELARIMTSPPLSTLTLAFMTFPLAQLLSYRCAFTNLRELYIFAVDNNHNPVEEFRERKVAESSSNTTITPISVEELTISPGDGRPFLESRRFDWESVRTLDLMPREPLFPQSGDELKECQDMLARTTNLSRLGNGVWSMNGQFDTLFSSVDVKFYTSLVHIDFRLNWSEPRWRISASGVGELEWGPDSDGFDHVEEPYMGLLAALSTFPSKSALETIRISLYLPFRNDEAAATAFNSTHWTRISSILTPERFPSLTLVYVGVRMPPLDHRPSVEAVTHELRGMPRGHLQEYGKLELEVLHAWS